MDKPRRTWPLIIVLILTTPVLYVLSSGPMRTVAFRKDSTVRTTTVRRGTRTQRAVIRNITTWDPWWPMVYRPLIWASGQSWGKPLKRYWDLFPIREL